MNRLEYLYHHASLSAAAAVVAHGDIHVHAAVGGIEAHDQGLSVFRALNANFRGMQFGGGNPEVHALVIESADGIADHLVGQFAHGIAHHGIGSGHGFAGEATGNSDRGGCIQIEDHAALDVPNDIDHGGDALAPVSFLIHADVDDFCGGLKGLAQDGVGGIDERLNQFHAHNKGSPENY